MLADTLALRAQLLAPHELALARLGARRGGDAQLHLQGALPSFLARHALSLLPLAQQPVAQHASLLVALQLRQRGALLDAQLLGHLGEHRAAVLPHRRLRERGADD